MATIENSDNARIGRAIRALRRRHGMRQKELAARCGFPQSRISKLEKGQQRILAVDLLRLAPALQVSYEVLLDWPEELGPPA